MRNPTVYIPTTLHHSDSFNSQTYRKVKQNMRKYLERSYTGEVSIYRERRGEWGEWFENWILQNNKPTIIKQGWM
jgi:hypothetical protein